MTDIAAQLAKPIPTRRVAEMACVPSATVFSRKSFQHMPSGQLTLADALSLLLAEQLNRDLGLAVQPACAIAYTIRDDWSKVVNAYPESVFLLAWTNADGLFDVAVLDKAEMDDLEQRNPPPASVLKVDLATVWRTAERRAYEMGLLP